MKKRESLTRDDKILQALRILTRGETIPAEDSNIGKLPADDSDIGSLEVAEEAATRR